MVGNYTITDDALLISTSATVDYGACKPGSTPGLAGANVPVINIDPGHGPNGDFRGCPSLCPKGR